MFIFSFFLLFLYKKDVLICKGLYCLITSATSPVVMLYLNELMSFQINDIYAVFSGVQIDNLTIIEHSKLSNFILKLLLPELLSICVKMDKFLCFFFFVLTYADESVFIGVWETRSVRHQFVFSNVGMVYKLYWVVWTEVYVWLTALA